MIDEWAARTPGVTRVPKGEGVLDTPEKIEAHRLWVDDYRKKFPRPGLRKPRHK